MSYFHQRESHFDQRKSHVNTDGSRHCFFIGITSSLALHMGFAIAYFWTPNHNYQPPPAAAPIAVSIVAPLSAPNKKANDLPQAPDQQATIARIPTPMEPPAAKHKIADKKPKLIAAKSDKPSPFKAIDKPEPKKVATDSILKPEPEPIAKQTKTRVVKIKPLPNKSVDETPDPVQSVAKQATSIPTIEVNKQSRQVSALQTGQLSEQGEIARLNWKQVLHAHLEREKRYPRKAKRMRKQGMPIISFTLDRKGKVLGVSLVESSGTSSLDNEALDLAYRAQPLPAPPKTIPDNELTLTLPINFSM